MSLILITLACLDPAFVFRGEFLPGLMNGTEWGQVSIAATWCALGPFSLARRLPLAAGWLAGVILANGISLASDLDWRGDLLLIFATQFLLQWVFVQMAIWPIALLFDLRISYRDDGMKDDRDRHFGIREILILMIVVATVLGVGRLTLKGFTLDQLFRIHREIKQGIVIASLNVLIALPLIAAGVSRNRVVLASVAAVAFALIAPVVEVQLLALVRGSPAEQHELFYWVWTNLVQSVWILAVHLVLRTGGYRFVSRRATTS